MELIILIPAEVILTGKITNTLGGQLLSQVTGLSPETANFAYSLPSLYTGLSQYWGQQEIR